VANSEELTEALINFLNKEEGLVIALDGEWGIGKTHFWNKFENKELLDKKVAYISLFGKTNTQEIRKEIALKLYPSLNKGLTFMQNIKTILKSMSEKYLGVDITDLLTIMSKKNFKDSIICFDDIERTSNLDMNSFLGLIAELKEQKNSKVIVIYHSQKQKDSSQNMFSEYKDKIIDYEILFTPTPEESFVLISNQLKHFREYPLKYFQEQNILNIRVMIKVINALNDFGFIEDLLKDNQDIKDNIVNYLIRLSTINAISYKIDIKKLLKEHATNIYFPDTKKIKQDDNKYYKYLGNKPIQEYFSEKSERPIITKIIQYLQESFLTKEDKQEISKLIAYDKTNKIKSSKIDMILNMYRKFQYDLNYSDKDFINELINWVKVNNEELTSMSPVVISWLISIRNNIINIAPEKSTEFDKDNIEVFKFYLKYIMENKDFYYGQESLIDGIKNISSELNEYYQTLIYQKYISKIDTMEKVIFILNKIYLTEDDLNSLLYISHEKLKDYFLSSYNFINSIMYNIIDSNTSSNAMKQLKQNLIKVMKDIQNTGTKAQKDKITKILTRIEQSPSNLI